MPRSNVHLKPRLCEYSARAPANLCITTLCHAVSRGELEPLVALHRPSFNYITTAEVGNWTQITNFLYPLSMQLIHT